ncbi:hypothetical protein THRCLA_07750 [Thraustotheca clavata]|uniref:EF-hand domain-containing protein n=1 Tax=Thraustotheca clavata TaxID=74557 RepID=A0A1V9ZC64_9STRA|nr:hypothetical protein THRCLA_07750 [Thraustotheca clavata]
MIKAARIVSQRSRSILRRGPLPRAYMTQTNLYQRPEPRVPLLRPQLRQIELAAPAPSTLAWKAAQAIVAMGAVAVASSDKAQCFGENNKKDDDVDPIAKMTVFLDGVVKSVPKSPEEFQHRVNEFLASGEGGQISWGFMMGACSGYAMKKVSKIGAIVLGCTFMAMQTASYYGYLDVNYKKLERDFHEMLDLNKDGKVDTKDMDLLYKKTMDVLEFSLPAGSGFAAGFLIGFRSG